MANLKNIFALALLMGMSAVFLPVQAQTLPSLNVSVSANELEQSDALVVVVKDEAGLVSGKLGVLKLHFFRSENQKDWIAVAGINFNKKPGNYKLSVKVPGKSEFKQNVKVVKRDYKETQLVVTPDLSQKGYTPKTIINNLAKENKDLGKALNAFSQDIYPKKPFIYPLDEIKITGDFGEIRKSKASAARHLGVDLKAPIGTPVYAINDGKVVLAKTYVNYGNTIIIDHGLGVYAMYLHLSEFRKNQGDMVTQGDIIGLAGDTGYAVGPHLHLSLNVRGASLDALKFIQATQFYRNY